MSEGEENLQDTLCALRDKLFSTKTLDGHNINNIQITNDPNLRVLLTKITIYDKNSLLEDPSAILESKKSEKVLALEEFVNLVEKRFEEDKEVKKTSTEEKAKLEKTLKLMEEKVKVAFEKARRKLEKNSVGRKPTMNFLNELKNGILDKPEVFREKLEQYVRDMSIEKWELEKAKDENLKKMEEAVDRTVEFIGKMSEVLKQVRVKKIEEAEKMKREREEARKRLVEEERIRRKKETGKGKNQKRKAREGKEGN